MEENFAYRKLRVYQNAKEYAKYVHDIIDAFFPMHEKYAMADQLRRSSCSVPYNIAESTGRYSTKEQIHFIEIAFGSLYESMCQMELAVDFGYIQSSHLSEAESQVAVIAKQLSGLRDSKSRQLDATIQVNPNPSKGSAC